MYLTFVTSSWADQPRQLEKRKSVYLTFVMERELFAIAATLGKYPLIDVEAASGQYRGTLAGERLRACGVQAARFDFSAASIS